MADLKFTNTPWTYPDFNQPGTVIIKDSWPQWEKDMWTKMLASAGITVASTLWKPTYQPLANLTVSEPDNKGGLATQTLNQQYFVTKESADYLANLFGATVTPHIPDLAGGIESIPAGLVEYYLNWVDQSNIFNPVPYSLNAGAFAYFFCPGADPTTGAPGVPSPATVANPSLAIQECLTAKNTARLDALRLAS